MNMMAILLVTAGISLAADRQVLTDSSYGIVTFGSQLSAVEKRVGEAAKWDNGDQECDFVRFDKLPGIYFMVEKGIVTRADAVSPQIENQLRIKVGSSLKEVKRRYPDVSIEPHKYEESGHYLIFMSKDRKRAMVFEELGGKVTEVRAGLEPSVEYVEGCQ